MQPPFESLFNIFISRLASLVEYSRRVDILESVCIVLFVYTFYFGFCFGEIYMSTYLEYKQNVKVVKKIKRKTIFRHVHLFNVRTRC